MNEKQNEIINYEEIIETHFTDDEMLGVTKESVEDALKFYDENYPDFSLDDRVEAIKMDIYSGQIYAYNKSIKEVEVAHGVEAAKEFESRILKLESTDILKTMGGDVRATEKLHTVLVNYKYEVSPIIESFTHFNENFKKSYDLDFLSQKYEKLFQSVDMSDRNAVTDVFRQIIDKLKSSFAFKILYGFRIRKLLEMAEEAIERLQDGKPLLPQHTVVLAQFTA